MTKLRDRLDVRSGPPSEGVVSYQELSKMSDDELLKAIDLVERKLGVLLRGEQGSFSSRSKNNPQARRRLAQLVMNKRLLEEEKNDRFPGREPDDFLPRAMGQ